MSRRSDLKADPDRLIPLIDTDTALVVVQYPDFFGRIYDYTKLAEAAHAYGSIIGNFSQPHCSGITQSPRRYECRYRYR